MSDGTDWLNAAGSVATCIALVVAVRDQRAALKWKRAEFVAQQIKEWEAQPGVQAVFQILDYTGKRLVPTDYGGRTSQQIIVSSEVLRRALELPHVRREQKQSKVAQFELFEHDLRHFFDQFFEGLARFQLCVEAGLVGSAAFKPYLAYWSDRMSGKALHGSDTLEALRSFAEHFHEGAPELLTSVGTTFVAPARPPPTREHVDFEAPAVAE